MDKFIVAEITKNWKKGDHAINLLSQTFEEVINTNAERGYKLIDWKFNAVFYNKTMCETIIAIFEKDLFKPLEVHVPQK